MTFNKEKLKPVIEYILKQEAQESLDSGDQYDAAYAIYDAEVTPSSVLALIAESERLERLALDSVNAEYAGSMDLESICAERDQLRAEVAGLRTGYEAYEQVNAELKAENERLRAALDSCAEELAAEVICKHGGQKLEDMHPVTRRLYERDMAPVVEARAALGQGEQS